MLASTHFDPVVGVDIHIVLVPAPPSPAPIPTPIPMPFMGLVFDPFGLIVSAGLGMAMGGGPGIVLVNGLPATNCGTEATLMLTCPHLPAPGVAFAVGLPGNDAELYFGSYDVSFGGSFAVRLGDFALSCSDPVRLPTSVVLALPKGCPVLVLRPQVPDLATIAMDLAFRAALAGLRGIVRAGGRLLRFLRRIQHASPRWARLSSRLGRWVDNIAPQRLRSRIRRAICHLTGHPVDVATGRVLTSFVDFELPGPIPLRFERSYDSSLAWRDGVLGHGWSHSLDQAVWEERGKVVFRAEDGREVEFHVHDLPGREVRPGQEVDHPADALRLRRVDPLRWEVRGDDGLTRVLVSDAEGQPARLRSIRDRNAHTIQLRYGPAGHLAEVTDSGGRTVFFKHDARGYLSEILLPRPEGGGAVLHRRFEVDPAGDLAQVTDSLGHAWRSQYVGHLLVQEQNRDGLSFYFQYDGLGSGARCVRTWGDGGIYDHEITYDVANMKTMVESSVGGVTVYELDDLNQVVAVTDPLGRTTRYEHDLSSGALVSLTTPSGAVARWEYDERGLMVRRTAPDGAVTRVQWDEQLRMPTVVEHPGGAVEGFVYDYVGNLVEVREPDGGIRRFAYENGLLVSTEGSEGDRARLRYDERKDLVESVVNDQLRWSYGRDRRGGVVSSVDPSGLEMQQRGDLEGRPTRRVANGELMVEVEYSPEGDPVRISTPASLVEQRYSGYRWLSERREADAIIRFEHDTEGLLTAVVNEAGERHAITRDRAGQVIRERGFSGIEHAYEHSADGHTRRIFSPSGRATDYTYDPVGRVLAVERGDDSSAYFEYDERGNMTRARNGAADVVMERDRLGRLVALSQDGGERWVRSRYGPGGVRVELRSDHGARQEIERDERGEIVELAMGQARSRVRFERDAVGQETRRVLPGGVEVRWERDAFGRPLHRSVVRPASAPSSVGEPPEPMSDVSYVWSARDRIEAVIDAATGPTRYAHDRRGRLTLEARGHEEVRRLLDAVDNPRRSSDEGDDEVGAGGVLRRHNGSDFEYDEDGRRVLRRDPSGYEWRYRWDASGMLREVERPDGATIRFTYDALARRVSKALVRVDGDGAEQVGHSVDYVWDGHQVLHEEHSSYGFRTWYWMPDAFEPVLWETESGAAFSMVTDHLGAPAESYSADAERVWKARLDLYGQALVEEGNREQCPWRWPGQYEDLETGLHYNRWRYYDPRTGTYLSPDPLGIGGGLRPYAYVTDPLWSFDPFGLFEPWEVAGYGDAGHTGDGLDADELLGSAWLRQRGYGGRSKYVGRRNPSMATPPALHRRFTAAQRDAGLHDPSRIAGMTARENIRQNRAVREPLLAQWLQDNEGMSRRAARREAARRMQQWEDQAVSYSRRLRRLQREADEVRARRAGGC